MYSYVFVFGVSPPLKKKCFQLTPAMGKVLRNQSWLPWLSAKSHTSDIPAQGPKRARFFCSLAILVIFMYICVYIHMCISSSPGWWNFSPKVLFSNTLYRTFGIISRVQAWCLKFKTLQGGFIHFFGEKMQCNPSCFLNQFLLFGKSPSQAKVLYV